MSTKKISLFEFAKSKAKPDCLVCEIPEREEIDKIYRDGLATKPIIQEWLYSIKSYKPQIAFDEAGKITGLSKSSIEKHFQEKHHFEVKSVE